MVQLHVEPVRHWPIWYLLCYQGIKGEWCTLSVPQYAQARIEQVKQKNILRFPYISNFISTLLMRRKKEKTYGNFLVEIRSKIFQKYNHLPSNIVAYSNQERQKVKRKQKSFLRWNFVELLQCILAKRNLQVFANTKDHTSVG